MYVQYYQLPLDPPIEDHRVCQKYIECLANMVFAKDTQAKALNESNSKVESGQKRMMLDQL